MTAAIVVVESGVAVLVMAGPAHLTVRFGDGAVG